MKKNSRIYTCTGDSGYTSLPGGERVRKDDFRIELYGTLDELNAFLGWMLTFPFDTTEQHTLHSVQNLLFEIPMLLSGRYASSELNQEVERTTHSLEESIDYIQETTVLPRAFILPGGTPSAAAAHLCRTVCRRLERQLCRCFHDEASVASVLAFVNRLSDYLYVLAIKRNNVARQPEIFWKKCCQHEK